MANSIDDQFRPPQQNRSRQTLQRLLEASEKILSTKSVEELSVREVLKESGVSNGSFYSRFGNKDSFLKACWNELVLTLEENLDKYFDEYRDRPLAEKIRFLVERQVSRYYKYKGLFRAFSNIVRNSDLLSSTQTTKSYRESQQKLVDFLMDSADEIRHPDPVSAIKIAEFVTAAAARELVLFPKSFHASTVTAKKSKLIEDLSHLFLSYLRFEPEVD